MKPTGEKRGFTIIELLTVMSIIVILISLLVPSLNRVRRVAKSVAQRTQFYDIEKALEEYRADNDDEYPDSDPCDSSPAPAIVPYCGAMKLAEAMIGQDGMGLHEDSIFRADGLSADDSIDYYLFDLSVETDASSETVAQRLSRGQRIKYLENDDVGRCKLREMFPVATLIGPFQEDPDLYPNAVLCDVFLRTQISSGPRTGEKVGMPVLYYKADVRQLYHDANLPGQSIYNSADNYDLLALGLPWDALDFHPLLVLTEFYEATQNKDIITTPTPYKKDQYILISAGYDGRYGTRDDVFNFRR